MINFFDNVLKSYTQTDEYKSLLERIEELENKVKHLEEENIDTTNELYRLENSLDARIDILAEKFMRQNDLQ